MSKHVRKRKRILHSSDFHLDQPGDKACASLKALVKLAVEEEVDMMMIVGDLFDHNRVSDKLIKFVIDQLQCLKAPVVILPGNHDCLVPGCALGKDEFWSKCPNVRIIKNSGGEIVDFSEVGISVWGRPIDTFEDMKPMEGIPAPGNNGYWQIALAHGYYVGNGASMFPSYHITEEEITKSGWDYIALGHVVTFSCVCSKPVAYYCGAAPFTGMAAMVELSDETGVQVSQYEL